MVEEGKVATLIDGLAEQAQRCGDHDEVDPLLRAVREQPAELVVEGIGGTGEAIPYTTQRREAIRFDEKHDTARQVARRPGQSLVEFPRQAAQQRTDRRRI